MATYYRHQCHSPSTLHVVIVSIRVLYNLIPRCAMSRDATQHNTSTRSSCAQRAKKLSVEATITSFTRNVGRLGPIAWLLCYALTNWYKTTDVNTLLQNSREIINSICISLFGSCVFAIFFCYLLVQRNC